MSLSAPNTTLPRRIAHLDMDAFYASVELLRYPQLKGLPVVIGGARRTADTALAALVQQGSAHDIAPHNFPTLAGYVGRGVITTATYAARQFGVGSAMGLMKAAKLCPQAILLPVDFSAYKHYSRLFKSKILQFAPLIEDRGIDEVYIDFTHAEGGQEEGGRVLAAKLQAAIFELTELTCSIGVAPNKLLAKMASEFNKPNGITVLWAHELQDRVWPLPCRKINGIGPKADEKLKRLGISTIGDLATKERAWLVQHFGKSYGAWLNDAAWGRDERPVSTHSEPVSMSRETTFDSDLHAVRDRARLGAIFTRLCEQIAGDLRAKGYEGKTVGIKLRYDDFKSVTRDQTLDHPVSDAAAIRRAAGQCLTRVDLSRRLRLLGVKVANLRKVDTAAAPLGTNKASPEGLKVHEAQAGYQQPLPW